VVTRLSAVQDLAMMDVLCCDKTGTLTMNAMELRAVHVTVPGMAD
jgi:P-type E1-E2 ATPase